MLVADGKVNMLLWKRDILDKKGQKFIWQIHEEAVESRNEPENVKLRRKVLTDLMVNPNCPYTFVKDGGLDATVDEYRKSHRKLA